MHQATCASHLQPHRTPGHATQCGCAGGASSCGCGSPAVKPAPCAGGTCDLAPSRPASGGPASGAIGCGCRGGDLLPRGSLSGPSPARYGCGCNPAGPVQAGQALVRAKDGSFLPASKAAAGPFVRARDGSFRPAKLAAPGPFVMTKAGALVPAKAAAPRPAPPAVPRMPDYAGARIMPAASDVPGALGAGPALGEPVDAGRLCRAMIPGDDFAARGARLVCEEYAQGRDLATFCESLPAALSDYQGDCRRAVASFVESVAPRTAGEMLIPRHGATIDNRDREPLAHAVSLAQAVVGAIWPEIPRAFAAGTPPFREPTDFIQPVDYAVTALGLPRVAYFFGALPSGRRVFFSAYGRRPERLTEMSGVEVRPGDYVIEMKLTCVTPPALWQIKPGPYANEWATAYPIDTNGIACLPASTPLPVGAQPPPGPFRSASGPDGAGPPEPDGGGRAQAAGGGGVFPLLAMVAGLWAAAS